MDHSSEILSELRLLRGEMSRLTALMEAEEKRGNEQRRKMEEMDGRLRVVEQGLAARLVGAGVGGGAVAAFAQWLFSHFGA